MDQTDLDKRIRANAYRVFYSELEKHLAEACLVFDADKSPNNSDLKRVGATFHTIRGGAGFFGLDELATMAGRIEGFLLQDTKRACAELETVRKLVLQIATLAKNLPQPN